MSTFGALNTAFRGLTAAQQGIAVAGNNMANATTAGYTRQRVEQSSVAAPATGLFSGGAAAAGQGVSVDRISRLGSGLLDGGVRTAAAQAGFTAARSAGLRAVEDILQEPGRNSVSSGLQAYWAAWQGASNKPGDPAAAAVLLAAGNSLAATLNTAQATAAGQWNTTRSAAAATVAAINSTAEQVAGANAAIRSAINAGGSANELIDARAILTESLARLSGGTVKELPDGTINVFIDGNALVSGASVRQLVLAGPAVFAPTAVPVQAEWADRPGAAVAAGGELAGALSVLAPAANGSGGALAEAAAAFTGFAADLAAGVNAVHRTGQTVAGTAGGDFFAVSPGGQLSVVPRDATGIAVGRPGAGALDGSVADSLAQLGVGKDSPDAAWQSVVSGIGVAARTALQQDALASAAQVAASALRDSSSSVSLDEENISLLSNQHAYQAAARVMTAVDEALDVLINRTGLVGR